jgi:hypothetical protein
MIPRTVSQPGFGEDQIGRGCGTYIQPRRVEVMIAGELEFVSIKILVVVLDFRVHCAFGKLLCCIRVGTRRQSGEKALGWV